MHRACKPGFRGLRIGSLAEGCNSVCVSLKGQRGTVRGGLGSWATPLASDVAGARRYFALLGFRAADFDFGSAARLAASPIGSTRAPRASVISSAVTSTFTRSTWPPMRRIPCRDHRPVPAWGSPGRGAWASQSSLSSTTGAVATCGCGGADGGPILRSSPTLKSSASAM